MKAVKHIRDTFVAREMHPTAVLCLLSVVRYYGGNIDPKFLMAISKTFEGVTKLSDLAKAAEAAGLTAKGVRSTPEHLKKTSRPAILHVTNDLGENDYMVCYGYDGRFLAGIPAWGLTQFSDEEMMAVWGSRIMLYLEPSEKFIPEKVMKMRKRKWLASQFANTAVSLCMFVIWSILSAATFTCGIFLIRHSSPGWGITCSGLSLLFIGIACIYKRYGREILEAELSTATENRDVSLIPIKRLDTVIDTACSFVENIWLVIGLSILFIWFHTELPLPVLAGMLAFSVWFLVKIIGNISTIRSFMDILSQLYDFCTKSAS